MAVIHMIVRIVNLIKTNDKDSTCLLLSEGEGKNYSIY
jgi:hypothetical protein